MLCSKHHISVVLLLLMMAGQVFAQQWHTTIDVLTKAPMQLPDSVEHLLLVNNMAVQPDDFGHQLTVYDGENIITERLSVDLSRMPVFALFGMRSAIEEAEWAGEVTIIESSQSPSDQPFAKTLLNMAAVDSLCRRYDADAVLCLNQLLVNDVISLDCADYDYMCRGELSVNTISSWSVQYPHTQKVMSYSQADTLVWDVAAYNTDNGMSGLPDRQQYVLDMAMYVGERVAALYVPQWQTVDRYFYCNRDEHLQAGMEHLQHCRWQQAREQFIEASAVEGKSVKQRQTRAYAMADLAVLEEMQANRNEAVLWAQKAAEAFAQMKNAEGRQQQVNMLYYLEQLQRL